MTTSPAPRVVRDSALDWSKVDAVVARDGSLDPTAKALYMALTTFVDHAERGSDDDPDGIDVPTRAVLAACIGKSVDTVDRATKRLESYLLDGQPLLIVERRQDPSNPKSNIPSVYQLLDNEHWDARAAQRHAARGGRMGAARGGRMGAARGGRMGAARGGRMGAAVLFPPGEALQEEEQEGVEEPLTPPPPPTGRTREDESAPATLATGRPARTAVLEEDPASPNTNPADDAAVDVARGVLRTVTEGVDASRLSSTERATLVGRTAVLVRRGWDRASLIARLGSGSLAVGKAHSVYAVLSSRISGMPTEPPIKPVSVARTGAKPAWCGDRYCDAATRRLRSSETEKLTSTPCPRCGTHTTAA